MIRSYVSRMGNVQAAKWTHALNDVPGVNMVRRGICGDGPILCPLCGEGWHMHGEVTNAAGRALVHPGQYVIQGTDGGLYPMEAATFEAVFQ